MPFGSSFAGVDETVLERDGDVLGETDADEARRGDGVAVSDQRDGFARAHDFAVLEGVQRGDQIRDIGCVHCTPGYPKSRGCSGPQLVQTGPLGNLRASSGMGAALRRRYF